jgi:hypothetical protein
MTLTSELWKGPTGKMGPRTSHSIVLALLGMLGEWSCPLSNLHCVRRHLSLCGQCRLYSTVYRVQQCTLHVASMITLIATSLSSLHVLNVVATPHSACAWLLSSEWWLVWLSSGLPSLSRPTREGSKVTQYATPSDLSVLVARVWSHVGACACGSERMHRSAALEMSTCSPL